MAPGRGGAEGAAADKIRREDRKGIASEEIAPHTMKRKKTRQEKDLRDRTHVAMKEAGVMMKPAIDVIMGGIGVPSGTQESTFRAEQARNEAATSELTLRKQEREEIDDLLARYQEKDEAIAKEEAKGSNANRFVLSILRRDVLRCRERLEKLMEDEGKHGASPGVKSTGAGGAPLGR